MKTLIISATHVVNVATYVIAGIALLVFFVGLAKFVFKAGDEERNKAGKNLMVWGVVALFVMFATWGLVRFINIALGVPFNPSKESQEIQNKREAIINSFIFRIN